VTGPGIVLISFLAGVVCAAVGLRRWLFVVNVHGESMQPTLSDGDRVLARRTTLVRIRRGDVVVLERPDDALLWSRPPARRAAGAASLLIKRVAAVPGDPAPRESAPVLAKHAERLVPPGHLVAFGDNFHRSLDSKQIGYFPEDRLIGVVLRRMRSR
jgi:signal peptidase I